MQREVTFASNPARIDFSHSLKVLDVGCGEGFTVVLFARHSKDVRQLYENFRLQSLQTVKKAVNLFAEYTCIPKTLGSQSAIGDSSRRSIVMNVSYTMIQYRL